VTGRAGVYGVYRTSLHPEEIVPPVFSRGKYHFAAIFPTCAAYEGAAALCAGRCGGGGAETKCAGAADDEEIGVAARGLTGKKAMKLPKCRDPGVQSTLALKAHPAVMQL
jgi:hypothetical protein